MGSSKAAGSGASKVVRWVALKALSWVHSKVDQKVGK